MFRDLIMPFVIPLLAPRCNALPIVEDDWETKTGQAARSEADAFRRTPAHSPPAPASTASRPRNSRMSVCSSVAWCRLTPAALARAIRALLRSARPRLVPSSEALRLPSVPLHPQNMHGRGHRAPPVPPLEMHHEIARLSRLGPATMDRNEFID